MAFSDRVYSDFVNDFSIILRSKIERLEISKLIFLCIGTDQIIGDSFGPLVGYKLKKLFKDEENIEVVGDLNHIINSKNIKSILKAIYNKYEDPFLIAIDAAVSNKTEIGKIIVSNSKMNVASMLSNEQLYIGDLSIKGIVTRKVSDPKNNLRLLQLVPLNVVMDMADCVSQGIYNVINV